MRNIQNSATNHRVKGHNVTYISSHNIVGIVVDVPGQSKVTNFYQPAFCHQHISSCQISMDTLQTDRNHGKDFYFHKDQTHHCSLTRTWRVCGLLLTWVFESRQYVTTFMFYNVHKNKTDVLWWDTKKKKQIFTIIFCWSTNPQYLSGNCFTSSDVVYH